MPFYKKILFSYLVLTSIFITNTIEGKTFDSLYKQGFQLSIKGKTQNAIQIYLKALKINPNSAETHHALGVLYFENNNGAKAIDHFKKSELLYKGRSDKKASLNLIIIKNNLDKAYKKLALNANDFNLDILLSTEKKWTPSGVGFFIGKHGYILTSNSSIKAEKKIRVRFPNGQTEPAKLIQEFIVYKIAILKIINFTHNLTHTLIFESKPDFREGTHVYAMDFSKIHTGINSLSRGIILKEQALENSNKVIQLHLKVKKGENGGPLFNQNGKLIGIILTKLVAQQSFPYLKDSPENASFAIKSSYLKKILPRLISSNKQVHNQQRESNLKHGINVKKVPQEAINNFVFLETFN